MSSIGVIGIWISSSFFAFFFLWPLNGTPPVSIRPDQLAAFIALSENLWNPLAWQAVIRVKSLVKGVSRSARSTIVVGRPPLASGF